jgi:anti-repressor protein
VNEEMGLVPFEQKFPLEILWIEGEPLFNARDVAAGLLLSASARDQALKRMKPSRRVLVTNDMAATNPALTNCQCRTFNNMGEVFLREPGLYELAMTSRSEGAERFKDWVFEEVIPSIRKTGQYSLSRPRTPALPQNYEQALEHLLDAVRGKRQAEERLAIQAPMIEEYEQFLASHAEISMNEAAKVLNFPGMGSVKLYEFLRAHAVLMSHSDRWNLPYQDYVERGWFRVKPGTFHKRNHKEAENYRKTTVTPKGLVGLHRLLKKPLGPSRNDETGRLL